MSKYLYFLISFVCVLGLTGAVQAGTPIIVDNNSFEYDCNGVEVTCHTGHQTTPGEQCDGSIAAWRYLGAGWTGIDVNCGTEDEECDNCHDWIEYPDGTANLFFQGNASVHQILDFDIVEGHKYTATVDVLGWNPIVVEFFALEDVCNPDVNHIEISTTVIDATSYVDTEGSGRNVWMKDEVAIAVITDSSLAGKKLGIKIGGEYLIGGADTSYLWADNVRVEYDWASNAYAPEPADEETDVNSQALTLSWLPGLWTVSGASGHQVYFGTSWAEVNDANTSSDPNIYRGSGSVSGPDANRYSYVIPSGDLPLGLGETYYWRVDEVNDGYVGPAPEPWKGEVWSFEVEGRARNLYPSDGGTGAPALNLVLRWEAGTGAGGHDVYFGSNRTDVENATTATAGIYRSPTQPLSDVNYSVEDLDVRTDYFWRIDEVNTNTGTFVKGSVWTFRTGVFLIVDSFEWYPTDEALKAVWKDYWADTASKNGCQVFVETDPNFVRSGEQSMKLWYENHLKSGGKYVGSWATAATSDLESGTDWTVGGVKALVTYFIGDPCNGKDTTSVDQDRLWVALDDGSTEGVVPYDGDMSAVTEDWWHEWNVSLQDFNAANVDLSNVANVWLGSGGYARTGQSAAGAGYTYGFPDTVYFDDIRLYPPRCMPSVTGLDVLSSLGDIVGGGEEGTQDCNTDYLDLVLMAQEWNRRGEWATAGLPVVGPIIEYMFDEGAGTTLANTGSYTDPNYDLTIGENFDANGLVYMEPNNDPCWVNDADANRGWTLWFDGEAGMFPRESKEVELGGDYLIAPPINLTTNTASITAWIKPDPFCILDKQGACTDEYEFKDGFTGIIVNRTHSTLNPSEGTEAAALNFGGGNGFVYDGMLGYTWNDNASSTWNWNSDIFPVNREWNFVAVVIEPGKATCYMGDPNGVLLTATNAIAHTAEELDARTLIAGDIGHTRFYRGQMDDIRIYNYSLSAGQILGLAGIEGIVYVPLTSAADLIVGDKDPCYPDVDDQINFEDYTQLAKYWLEQHPWP
ncbi:MAG: LamG domain-containing protein [Planctomycetota bacterium]|jgi:hypothetical protein